jgi:two-component system phosphate regulon sensor histidine kinase PhoR
LLRNAVKFTPERGSIWFSRGTRDGEFRIEVRDTGMGIPEEHLSQIFRKFYRVPRAGTQIPGTGLGLSIVQSIVEHYHGRIEIESKVNQGSSFRVYFPAGGERGGGGAS